MIHYVCKYTPVELFKGFGEDCAVLEEMPENFELSDKIAHANLCGFGKSVIQAVLEGKVENLVLVNCCDSHAAGIRYCGEYRKMQISLSAGSAA